MPQPHDVPIRRKGREAVAGEFRRERTRRAVPRIEQRHAGRPRFGCDDLPRDERRGHDGDELPAIHRQSLFQFTAGRLALTAMPEGSDHAAHEDGTLSRADARHRGDAGFLLPGTGLRDGFRPPLGFPGYWLYLGDAPCIHIAEWKTYKAHSDKLEIPVSTEHRERGPSTTSRSMRRTMKGCWSACEKRREGAAEHHACERPASAVHQRPERREDRDQHSRLAGDVHQDLHALLAMQAFEAVARAVPRTESSPPSPPADRCRRPSPR